MFETIMENKFDATIAFSMAVVELSIAYAKTKNEHVLNALESIFSHIDSCSKEQGNKLRELHMKFIKDYKVENK